jgi:hypothetical protein
MAFHFRQHIEAPFSGQVKVKENKIGPGRVLVPTFLQQKSCRLHTIRYTKILWRKTRFPQSRLEQEDGSIIVLYLE